MKQKLLMKSLLAAAMLGVGGVNAWAQVEITETYDFGSFITANGTANLTVSGDGIEQSGTSAKVGTVKVINNLTANDQTLDLKGRFAVDYQYNAGSQIRFMWRSSGNAYQHGLAGQWNGNGTADAQGAARLSVLNLKNGDKITFTYAIQSGKAANPYTCSASQLTGVAADAALSSGTQYTVAADGNLDLYFINNNFAISKIVIITTGTETVSEPTFAITGAYNKTRKVTITAGASDAGNTVTTYYTTDGSTPTTSSPNSFTTASSEITVGEGAESEATVTVKAISVSSTTASSDVAASNAITVGTVIKLAQPSINLTGMGLDGGNYYKQYTFVANATGTYGNPTISVAGSFGGNAVANPYTASAAGTVSVVASADGYADSDPATLDVDGNPYLLARAYDFTQDSYRDGLSVAGNNITITGAGVQVYQINDVNHIEGITLSGTGIFGFTKAQNSNTRKGLAPRWNKGSFSINNWIDGSFATLTDYVGNGIYATSTTGTFSFGAQVNNNTFTALNIYTPADATVTATISATGWTTFASLYPLDLSGITASTGEVTAFYASAVGDGKVTMTSTEQAGVAAGQGIMLKGTSGATISIPVAASGTAIDGNKLVGCATATTISNETANYANIYVLSNNNGTAEFQNVKDYIDASNTVAIAAGKAYLNATGAGAASLNIVFNDESTGIDAIDNGPLLQPEWPARQPARQGSVYQGRQEVPREIRQCTEH